jgi:hypothetical protein
MAGDTWSPAMSARMVAVPRRPVSGYCGCVISGLVVVGHPAGATRVT